MYITFLKCVSSYIPLSYPCYLFILCQTVFSFVLLNFHPYSCYSQWAAWKVHVTDLSSSWLLTSVSVSYYSCNQLPPVQCLNQHKFILSQLWRSEVWNEFYKAKIKTCYFFFLVNLRGESFSLPFLASRGYPHFLACGHASHFSLLPLLLLSHRLLPSLSFLPLLYKDTGITFRAHLENPE